ncbi:hypothetical protein GCM10027299_17460 [Larkinella ripae]
MPCAKKAEYKSKKALFANQSAKIGNPGGKNKPIAKSVAKVNRQEMKAIPVLKRIADGHV